MRNPPATIGGPVANWGKLRERRVGVGLHYDGSASDPGAVNWLTKDPRCKVSYNRLVTDDGQDVKVAPDDARAWHAGTCKPSASFRYKDGNSALYGLAFAAKAGDALTAPQIKAAVRIVRGWFADEGWPLTELWRITDHATEAWPRGRKVDIGKSLTYQGQPFTVEMFRSFVGSPDW